MISDPNPPYASASSPKEDDVAADVCLELVPPVSTAERRFALLSKAGALLLSNKDPEALIQEIAGEVMEHLGCDVFFNYVLDETNGRLRLNAYGGVDPAVADSILWLDKGTAVCGCVARDGCRIVSEDIAHNGDERAALVRSMGVQAYACHPLHVADATIGTLSFGTRNRTAFAEDELTLMRTVADLVSVAIERARAEEALRISQSALEASEHQARELIRYAPTGIYEVEFEPPRFVNVNEAMCSLSGYSAEELLAMNPFDLLDEPSRQLFRQRIGQMQVGETPSDQVEYNVIRKDGEEIIVALNVRLAYDRSGRASGAFVIGHDITERRRADEERARLLAIEKKRRKRIEALHQVLEVAVSSLSVQGAASGILAYLDEHHDFDHTGVWMERGGLLDLVASTNYPDAYLERYSPVAVTGPLDVSVVFRSGEPIRVGHISRGNPQVTQAYAELGIELGAYAVVPIRSRGKTIGVLHICWRHGRDLSDEDIEYYQSLGAELGVVLENARLYEAEHGIAETLQETLVVLPSQVAGIEFSRSYESATFEAGRVGGDFVDVFEVQPDIVAVSLGDVSGKGIGAAVTTSLVRNTLRVHALDGLPAALVVEKANAVMRRFIEVDSFVTLWFGLLDTRSGELHYVCAGHPPALVASRSGEVHELAGQNPFLGAFAEVTFKERSATLLPGDRLVLYSDGVIEARSPDGHLLGEHGFHDLVRGHRKYDVTVVSRLVMDEVVKFSAGVLRDDAALLVVEPTRRKR